MSGRVGFRCLKGFGSKLLRAIKVEAPVQCAETWVPKRLLPVQFWTCLKVGRGYP